MAIKRRIFKGRSLRRDQRGNVLVLTAAGLPLLLGCAGLAVDVAQWVLAKRQVQSAVDAAAMAGVYGLIQNGDMEEAVSRSLSLDRDLDRSRSVDVERSPNGFAEDPYAVRVRVTVPAQLTFASLFLRTRPTITAEAVANVVENGEFCAFALGSAHVTGLQIKPNSNLKLECGIATNSSSNEAISADDSSSVDASAIVAFGGIEAGKAIKSTGVRSYGLRQKDPLADTEPPLVPNTGCPNATVNSDAASRGRVVLQPGCYGNMVLNGPVSLEAGEYILNRGNLVIGPTAEVTCKSCTFFLTSQDAATDPGSIGKVKIHHHAKVKLTAPEQGPNAGILIYQDRRAAVDRDGFENVISGNSFSELRGLLYFPSETIRLDARMGPDVKCARLVGRRLIVEGRVVIAKGCSSSGSISFAGTEVRLVS